MSDFVDEPAHEEPPREIYYLKNFIGFFDKRNIRIKTLYILDDRVVFIHVSYGTICSDLWIYVTSEHDISAEGVSIPKIKIIQQEEDYQLPSGSAMIRDYLHAQLEHVQNGKVKMLHSGKKFIVYITRHNEVDFFELADTPADKGFYFVTEWKHFFDHSKELPLTIKRLEESIIHFAYETLGGKESDVTKAHKIIKDTVDGIGKSTETAKRLVERSRKCDRLFEQTSGAVIKSDQTQKQMQQIQELAGTISQDNLQHAFQTFIITETLSKLNKIF